jgi:anti-anti-sigma factor
MRERPRAGGTLILSLLGELDFAVTDALTERLHELKATGRAVTLDLSRLVFIDSSGVQALLAALVDARWSGWRLEVSRELSPSVERAAKIAGIARVFWAEDHPTGSRTSHGHRDADS